MESFMSIYGKVLIGGKNLNLETEQLRRHRREGSVGGTVLTMQLHGCGKAQCTGGTKGTRTA